jgi:hypothetical protein
MKRIGLAALTLLQIISWNCSAAATDFPIPFKNSAPEFSPPPRWTGFYVGINGGAGIGPTTTIPSSGYVLGGLSDVRLGWAAGAGVEYAFNQNWSAKVEYLYVDLGSGVLVLDNVKFSAHLTRGGVNWRF